MTPLVRSLIAGVAVGAAGLTGFAAGGRASAVPASTPLLFHVEGVRKCDTRDGFQCPIGPVKPGSAVSVCGPGIAAAPL